jgi:hypothetical protein
MEQGPGHIDTTSPEGVILGNLKVNVPAYFSIGYFVSAPSQSITKIAINDAGGARLRWAHPVFDGCHSGLTWKSNMDTSELAIGDNSVVTVCYELTAVRSGFFDGTIQLYELSCSGINAFTHRLKFSAE